MCDAYKEFYSTYWDEFYNKPLTFNDADRYQELGLWRKIFLYKLSLTYENIEYRNSEFNKIFQLLKTICINLDHLSTNKDSHNLSNTLKKLLNYKCIYSYNCIYYRSNKTIYKYYSLYDLKDIDIDIDIDMDIDITTDDMYSIQWDEIVWFWISITSKNNVFNFEHQEIFLSYLEKLFMILHQKTYGNRSPYTNTIDELENIFYELNKYWSSRGCNYIIIQSESSGTRASISPSRRRKRDEQSGLSNEDSQPSNSIGTAWEARGTSMALEPKSKLSGCTAMDAQSFFDCANDDANKRIRI